ncbi:MarR family winged helix-turn-helix transcriptional regulator [Pelagibius sp. Alg239-R121]|uniref:MarR family winged helix-turn-helix transcriptional regulator n=1 Tax=Pelagibius sp. Alg239-R121 TaxID=2993448 RepID=UPI0024A6B00B|nr:MarR family transcriptional regulator [Pelagibius sp. Alg239-R121]
MTNSVSSGKALKNPARQKLAFQFFTEVGIIQQLGTALFNKRLPEGLHVSHFSILNHMMRLGDGKTPLSLAESFQVTKGTMTHTLAGLTKRGLVRVEPNALDGRSKLVFLTDDGRVFHKTAIESLAPMFAMLDEKIDFDKLIEVIPLLQEVREILDSNRDM